MVFFPHLSFHFIFAWRFSCKEANKIHLILETLVEIYLYSWGKHIFSKKNLWFKWMKVPKLNGIQNFKLIFSGFHDWENRQAPPLVTVYLL